MVEAFQALFGLLRYQFSVRYLIVFSLVATFFEFTQIVSRFIPAWILTYKETSLGSEVKSFVVLGIFVTIQMVIDIRLDVWIMLRHLLKPWKNVNKQLFTHLMDLDIAWHLKKGTGATAARVPKGISRMMDLIVNISWEFFPSVIQFLLSIITLSLSSPITVPPISIAACLIVYITYWGSEQTKEWRKESNNIEENLNTLMVQMIQGLQDILFSANPLYFESLYYSLVHRIDELEKKTSKFKFLRTGAINIAIARFTEIFVIYLLYIQNKNGSISDLVYFGNVTVSLTLFTVINRTTRIMDQVEKTSESIISTYNLLQAKITVLGGNLETKPSGNIVFSNVKFSHGESKNIFTNLCLEIVAGTKVALVGQSGAGKSTIVNLLTRIFDIDSGEISIGGVNVNEFKLYSLRSVFVYVFQSPYMFMQSVKDNVLMGITDEHTSDEIHKVCNFLGLENPNSCTIDTLIWLALKKVKLESIFTSLEVLIGERGVNLSGGQKQRMAIARALLQSWFLLSIGERPIIVLDEPTSNLDSESELIITDEINELNIAGCSIITIAHRLSTISKYDCILVLAGGRVAEKGSHDELMTIKNGIYAKMIALQNT